MKDEFGCASRLLGRRILAGLLFCHCLTFSSFGETGGARRETLEDGR